MNEATVGPASDAERNWGMYAHLAGVAGFLLPVLGGFVGALAILLTKGRRSAYVAAQAREALNFQLSISLATLLGIALAYVLVGVFVLIGVAVADVGCIVRATKKAARGEMHRYPLRFSFLK